MPAVCRRTCRLLLLVVLACGAARPVAAQMVIELEDVAAAPITGRFRGEANQAPLARINVLRPEPGGTGRMFLADLNGPLYIVDAGAGTFTPYLDFNGRDGRPGLFQRFTFMNGWANGLITVQFDPAYPENGRFYTIHMEEPQLEVSPMPVAGAAPGLDLTGYETTTPEPVVGVVERHCVLIEWTDRDTANATFEGQAREVLRFALNTRIHPPGDVAFNPAAVPGDPDWRVMYVAAGDGGSGEARDERRRNPQRLDMLVGKILRIVPDPELHTGTSRLAPNGRYRVPRDNPFVDVEGARGEVWALGLRNPHRLQWEIDPDDASRSRLLAINIGLHTWESVYVVEKGANYGYSEREGTQLLRSTDNQTSPLPADDRIPLRIDATATKGTVTPVYPVLQYPHTSGFAIAGGFVYRGSRLPALRGKFIFGDVLNGRVWYADYDEMLAAHDGDPATLATMHEVALRWRAPGADVPEVHQTMRTVAGAGYEARRAADPSAAGATVPTRTDLRFAAGADGEIYVTTKTDGMIRAVVAAEVVGPAEP